MQELDRSGWCAHSACRTQAYLIVLTRMHVRTPQGRRSTIIIDCQRSGSPRLAVWAASPCTVAARASAAMDSSPYWASGSGSRVPMAHEPVVCFEVLRNRVRALGQPRNCAGYSATVCWIHRRWDTGVLWRAVRALACSPWRRLVASAPTSDAKVL